MNPSQTPVAARPQTLDQWLAHCDSLHVTSMDLSLERTVEVRRRLAIDFRVPLIAVAGTNGKGSTCAMLEAIALQAGYRVGVYQKPELVFFEERCRIGGRAVAAEALLPHLDAVESARGEITLTRFEFTTLAIARLLAAEDLDLVVLEVGLGGRFDAVNAFDADCVVITSIALDHMEFLGPDRESIGFEKAHLMRPGRPAIVSDPVPPQTVIDHAAAVGADLWLVGRDFATSGDPQQWSWSGRRQRFNSLAYPALRGANQLLNAAGALAVFEALRDRLPITAQAVRNGLALVELPGRFQVVAGQPTLVLDVAHNPHAVATLTHNLDRMGFFPRTHVVFGVMADKDVAAMLTSLAPLVDNWFFTDLPSARASSAHALAALHASLALRGPGPVAVSCHADPQRAIDAAIAVADPADRIVVLGSFLTLGGILRNGLPRLAARHVG